MTRLEWGTTGERYYEAGVDRGVLYVNGAGVPWNGLISVEENLSGGEAKPLYQDGIKYSNRASLEEFGATITAFTYPEEFSACDGSGAIGFGLYATQQRRRPFGFSYRTRIGNDVDGDSFGYKIHLVYNALAAPSSRSASTLSDSVEAANFSWEITTKPPVTSRLRPTSHFVIDSRIASNKMLETIEEILYGTDNNQPRLLSVEELIYRFEVDASGIYDAGIVGTPQFITLDGGVIPEFQSSTVDGGFA